MYIKQGVNTEQLQSGGYIINNKTAMNQLEAIKYLAEHAEYGNEWQGAGMWEAVTTVLATGKTLLTKEYLDTLIKRAEDF